MHEKKGAVMEEENPLIDEKLNEGTKESLEVAESARQKEYTQPSFGAQLFLGNFRDDMLFPFPMQDAEDQKIGDDYIEKLEQFLKENLNPDEVDRTREIPNKVLEGLAKLGAFAIKIPKKYGGLGFSKTNYNRIAMKIASYCGATATLVSAHQSIGVPQPLLMYGTEEQRQKFFPRFAKKTISAFALTEPDVGSDPAQMKTTAELSEDGTHYILNGDKLWCTNGTIADIIVVMAKTKPKIVNGKEKQQITAFILEMNTPGVSVTHRCEFMGLNGIYNGLLHFENVKIPKENLLWEEGRGLALALGTINVGRLTLPAASTGICKQMLRICRIWGMQRIQWGQPVGLHEEGRKKIAFIASTTFAMEAISLLTSKWADDEKVDIRIEAAMAKLFSTEMTWKVVDATMQLRGGRGYEKATSLRARGEPGYPVERALRDCRVNMILEGSTEIMNLFLAREALDPHLKRILGFLKNKGGIGAKIGLLAGLVGHYALWYPGQWIRQYFSRSFSDLGPLAKHYRFIDKNAHRLACKIFISMAKHQQKLQDRQLLLSRLMGIGTDLFVMAATCSYATALHKKDPSNYTPIALANFFCLQAERRIKENFSSLSDNDDKIANKLAKQVLDNEMLWMETGIMPLE